MCSEGKGRAQAPTQAWVRVPVGGVGATSKVGCTTSNLTAWHPARREAAAPGIYPRSAGAEGASCVRVYPAPATLRASPSGVGFHWEQLGRLSAAKDTLAKPAHRSPRSTGRNPEVLGVLEGVLGAPGGLLVSGGTMEAQPIIPQTREQARDSTHACVLGKWRAQSDRPSERRLHPHLHSRTSQILVLASSWQSAASHELKKIKRNKQTAPLLLLSIEVC